MPINLDPALSSTFRRALTRSFAFTHISFSSEILSSIYITLSSQFLFSLVLIHLQPSSILSTRNLKRYKHGAEVYNVRLGLRCR
jgi:hypothetical protein